jgi:hypothetical protein
MDLEALEQYVINTFGRVPTNKLPSDDFSQFAFRSEAITPEFSSIYYVKPVSDTTEVSLPSKAKSSLPLSLHCLSHLILSHIIIIIRYSFLLNILPASVALINFDKSTVKSMPGHTELSNYYS